MTIDAHKNFAYSTVATAPSPATSGTSLVVASGEGAGFPATPFNAVVCPAGTQPTAANAEVIRVTTRSTDTFSPITRAQEGSSARTIVAGDQIFVAVTAKTLTDIETDPISPSRLALPHDRQLFTANGTWTKPAGARLIRIIMAGGGGGGGAGRRGAAGSVRVAGGPGACSIPIELWFWADDLPATVAVTIGAAGTGGAAQTTDDTSGANGVAGGVSSFSTFARRGGGAAGAGGGIAAGGVAGACGIFGGNNFASFVQGSSASLTGANVASPGSVSSHPWATVCGAPGGGITSANVESSGTFGMNNSVSDGTGTVQSGGVAPGGTPAAITPKTFTDVLYSSCPSYGGAGGAGGAAGGGAGGNAQGYATGGGGGGASTNAAASGKGGDGTAGFMIVESWG